MASVELPAKSNPAHSRTESLRGRISCGTVLFSFSSCGRLATHTVMLLAAASAVNCVLFSFMVILKC